MQARTALQEQDRLNVAAGFPNNPNVWLEGFTAPNPDYDPNKPGNLVQYGQGTAPATLEMAMAQGLFGTDNREFLDFMKQKYAAAGKTDADLLRDAISTQGELYSQSGQYDSGSNLAAIAQNIGAKSGVSVGSEDALGSKFPEFSNQAYSARVANANSRNNTQGKNFWAKVFGDDGEGLGVIATALGAYIAGGASGGADASASSASSSGAAGGVQGGADSAAAGSTASGSAGSYQGQGSTNFNQENVSQVNNGQSGSGSAGGGASATQTSNAGASGGVQGGTTGGGASGVSATGAYGGVQGAAGTGAVGTGAAAAANSANSGSSANSGTTQTTSNSGSGTMSDSGIDYGADQYGNPDQSNFQGGGTDTTNYGQDSGMSLTDLVKKYGEQAGTAIFKQLISARGAGGLLAAGLGAFGANQQRGQLAALADKYYQVGAPSRARYEASFGNGFTMANDPGYTDALNQASKASLHGLSVQGNPAGSPNAWGASLSDLYQKTAYPALQNYRSQNAASGGMASLTAASPGAATGAIGAGGNVYNAVGAGISDIFNPPKSLAQQYAEMRAAGMQ